MKGYLDSDIVSAGAFNGSGRKKSDFYIYNVLL
jgi:hypothetical protein